MLASLAGSAPRFKTSGMPRPEVLEAVPHMRPPPPRERAMARLSPRPPLRPALALEAFGCEAGGGGLDGAHGCPPVPIALSSAAI